MRCNGGCEEIYVYVITPFRVLLPEGGGLINRNNTIKGVRKCLLWLRDAFATHACQ